MNREPADDAASKDPDQDRTAAEQLPKTGSRHPAPDPKDEDDGSVPDKQIHRWKGEGGS